MANLNNVFLIGRLTRDPELRYAPSGVAVCDLSMAINNVWTTSEGEKKEETTFVNISTWQKQAENCSQFLNKGSEIFVEGRLRLSQWKTDAGEKQSKLDVMARRVQFLDKKPTEEREEE